ncbi:MAG: CHAD domain-containing protein [Cyanobacteria bacterium J06638_28]
MVTTVDTTVAVLATQAVGTYLERAEGYEKAVLKDRDPENLHQMRVNLRRLRTVMQVFAPGIQLPRQGQEARVAQVARRLGKLRDLDVMLLALQDRYAPDLPDAERKYLKTVFKYLRKQRRQAFKQAKRELRGDRYRQLKKSLHRWIKNPHCTLTARLSIELLLPDLTLPVVSELWLQPGWLVGTQFATSSITPQTNLQSPEVDALVLEHDERLHDLRKQVKRVRYQLRTVADFYGDRLQPTIEQLATLQDTLGDLQDSLVLESHLQKALSRWESRLPTLRSLLADSRYAAWQQWQTLQQHFLDTHHREALRQILQTPAMKRHPESATVKQAEPPAVEQTVTSTVSDTTPNSTHSASQVS